MDGTTQRIVDFALGLRYEDLPADVVRAAAMRVFDSVGCALAARDVDPVRISLAATFQVIDDGRPSGRVIGYPELRVTPEAAVFLNSTMIRYLDFNDWAPNGHPSDMIGAFLALADFPGVTGETILTATVAAYEVFIGLTRASALPSLGWDQGFALGIATAAGLGVLLGLEREALGNAVGILAAAGIPTGATRSGELSMWKGAATAYAARNAVFVTMLARDGITGPPEAFEGRRGIWPLVTGEFDLSLGVSGRYRILDTALKPWPACYHAQAPIEAAVQLRAQLGDAVLTSIDVGTYREAWRSIGSESAKWDPQSRETADHSLPYMVARAVVDGEVTAASFRPEAYLDAGLRPLMSRITARADDAATAAYPDAILATLVAQDDRGGEYRIDIANPLGHPANPMSDEQLRAKFRRLTLEYLGEGARLDAAIADWEDIRAAGSVEPLLARL